MKKQTFCPKLWYEIFISKEGDVFTCCHKKPKTIGNIYQDRLQDICNNSIIQDLRQKSLVGKLECYGSCTILQKDKNRPLPGNLCVNYSDLRRLKISFADQCNINCIMCHRSFNGKVVLDFDIIKKQVDLSPFKSIEIQGGEPLFIETARKFFDHASAMNKKISFLTNGTLINDEWAEKIALHSSFVYFSLNAATKRTHEFVNKGSRWELVLENIQRVRNARDELHSQLEIIGHMTIVKRNLEEIPLFIKTFSSLGFDSIDFNFDIQVQFYLKYHPFKAKTLSLKIKEAISNSREHSLINDYRLRLLKLV